MKFFRWKQLRNDLEAYSYEMRGALEEGGNFYAFCEPGIRDQFQENITKKIDWLYGDGENAPLNDYE